MKNKLERTETWFQRRVLRIPCTKHLINTEVLWKIKTTVFVNSEAHNEETQPAESNTLRAYRIQMKQRKQRV